MEAQSSGWGKLLTSTSRLFFLVASLVSSLSKTGTGRAQPQGRRGSAEKLVKEKKKKEEEWTNAKGLPPLTGCLWDSPSQPGEGVLMIALGEDVKGGVQALSCMFFFVCFFFALVSCVTLFCEGKGRGHPNHMLELDLLHKHRPPQPPVCSHQVLFCKYMQIKHCRWHWWPRRAVEMFAAECCIPSPHSSHRPLQGKTAWEETKWFLR